MLLNRYTLSFSFYALVFFIGVVAFFWASDEVEPAVDRDECIPTLHEYIATFNSDHYARQRSPLQIPLDTISNDPWDTIID